ncbi:MAG: glutathione S-transferase N-terminal domain-containing protein [Pseudomonadota bacterium]
MFRLISATPSPYARKVRIALLEKGIPFELVTEVPWDQTTTVPQYNPLEKLPVLICDDGSSIYESSYILEWLEMKFPAPQIFPSDPMERLRARRLEVLADGVCDAVVLTLFEKMRGAEHSSPEWLSRQRRKIEGGIRAIGELIGSKEYAVGNEFGLGDLAAGTALAYLDVRIAEFEWRTLYPNLATYSDRMEARAAFAQTRPVPQTITDKVV